MSANENPQKSVDESVTTEVGVTQALQNAFSELLCKNIQNVDNEVRNVRESQVVLGQQIEALNEQLLSLMEANQSQLLLQPYIDRLINAKRRIHHINTIVTQTLDRVNKIQALADKETAKRGRNVQVQGAVS